MELCTFCKEAMCETLEINGRVIKTIQAAGDIFERRFEIETCEVKQAILDRQNGTKVEPGCREKTPQRI